MNIRQRIQHLERMIGRPETGVSTAAIHATMSQILTDPEAHDIASSLGATALDLGVLGDLNGFAAMLNNDDQARDEVLCLSNLLADVRYTAPGYRHRPASL